MTVMRRIRWKWILLAGLFAEVTVMARYSHQAELARKLGASHTLRGRGRAKRLLAILPKSPSTTTERRSSKRTYTESTSTPRPRSLRP